MQTDPVGYEDQMNLYAYVHNDPMNGTDPSGMESEFTCDNPGCMFSVYARFTPEMQVAIEDWSSRGDGTGEGSDGNGEQQSAGLGNTTSIAGTGLTGAAAVNAYAACASGSCFGKWQGVNGKWYNVGWGGNKWTGSRGNVLFDTQSFRVVGRGLTVVSMGVEGAEMHQAISNRDGFGVVDSGIDFSMMAPTVLGGPVGFGLGIGYSLIDNTIGWRGPHTGVIATGLRVFKILCHSKRTNALRLLATDFQSRKRSIQSAA